MVNEERCDVLVIGGGGSGLAAAIEAATAGARVVLLEKNPRLGGTTALSVGSITATGTPHQLRQGVQDSPAEHASDLEKINARRQLPDNPALRKVLTENVTETFEWLEGIGVEFIGPLPEPPHQKPRMHCVVPTSASYISRLQRRAEALGVEIKCGVNVTALNVESGRAVGASATDSRGTPRRYASKATVLATGDFSGNAEMVSRYVGPAASTARPVNATNTGDGHRMAMSHGARILNGQIALLSIRFLPPAKKPLLQKVPPMRVIGKMMRLGYEWLPETIIRPFVMAFITSVLQPAKGIYQAGAILVNREGRRFGDETADLAPLLTRQTDAAAYLVFDERIAQQFSRWPNFVSTAPGAGYAYVADYRRHRRDLWHKANSIAELAGALRVPADALQATITDYNENTAKGSRAALERAPFYALGPLTTVLVFTDGGLAVDTRLRVLDAADRPIPGLYAAGAVGQGGAILDGHGHHIGWAFVSGRLAGKEASAHAPLAT